ncbi:MAG: acetyltransferase [Desulfobacterales bacterium]
MIWTTDIDRFRDLRLLICLGNPLSLFTKKKIMESLGIGTNRLITLIHANAIVSKTATIGNGSIILSGVTVMANTTIGSSCYIASNSNIGHDTILHDYAFVAPLVGVPGNVKIEQGAYLGISSCIRGGVTVGEWSVVGMGSVVTSDVSPYHVVAGNPAKTIRVRNASDFKF